MKLKSIKLENFKNIKNSKIEFKSNNLSAIYGPNGSGKTAVIEAIEVVREYFLIDKPDFMEKELDEKLKNFIKIGETTTSIELEIEGETKKYKIILNFSKDKFNNILPMEEKILYKNADKKRETYKKLISFKSYEAQQIKLKKSESINIIEKILKQQETSKLSINLENVNLNSYLGIIFSQIIENQKSENKIELNDELENVLINFLEIENYLTKIFVITLENQAMTNLKIFLNMNIHLENSQGTIPITLNQNNNFYSENIAEAIINTIKQINGIFKAIIPDSELVCEVEGERITEKEKEKGINLYVIKKGDKISIKNESVGIQKIISILSALIYCIQDENALVVIDELDAHIFEYLLAVVLEQISEIAKGQLIFTAHNLSPMERLKGENIIVTSLDEDKINYSYFKRISKTTNLRQKYIRSQAIWSEDNINPLNISETEIALYMRKLVK